MVKESIWGSFLSGYFGSHKKKETKETKINTGYDSWEKEYYKNAENATNKPSHLTEEEEYAKFVETHMVDEGENIVSEQDMIEDAMFDGQPIELQETPETHLDDGPTPEPKEEPEFTEEEIEAFKALNKIEEIHEAKEEDAIEVPIPNETQPVEQPIETKVTSVKVSKPKAPKAPKPVKEEKPKAPKGRKPKAPKKK